MLSTSDFSDGLVAGVPVGTVVSHKFGERHFVGDADVEQLHDCGIRGVHADPRHQPSQGKRSAGAGRTCCAARGCAAAARNP